MITITHTPAEGTLIEGAAKGDGVLEILRGLRTSWRYFPSLGQIGLGQSRDRAAKTWHIQRAADALRAAGHEVAILVDNDERRDVAEAEADRADRAEARAERLEDRAGQRGQQASADYDRARQMAEAIPFGQPVLTDHYSAGRDLRYRAKIERTFGRAFDGMREAEDLQRRAGAAEANQAHRESIPATLRRIARLEADERRMQRALGPQKTIVGDGAGGHTWAVSQPCGDYRERLLAELAAVREQLTYWRGHVAAAEESGAKVWGRADFQRGDFAASRGQWYEVLRVNAKSVTVCGGPDIRPVVTAARRPYSWNDTLPYDAITGRKSAAEMTAPATEAGKVTA